MIVLALDTCLAACSAAVARDGVSLAWRGEPMARGHQERLAAMVEAVMAEAGVAFSDIERIGVTVGPGSFTGLRVGLAFAKGLALALDRSCVGVGALEALAGEDDASAAVIDAGRGRVYFQAFAGGAPLCGPDILDLDLAVARLVDIHPSGEMTLTGPAAALLAAALPRAVVKPLAFPDPRTVARLARQAPLTPPRPLYLRPADAKMKSARAVAA